MERFLRPLAIAVVIVEVCAALFTIPVFFAYLGLLRVRILLEVVTNPFTSQTFTITGLTLTFVLGVLAAIIAAQRGHRSWSIAFVILLALFAYSPLVLTWVQQSNTPFYNATTFYVDTTAITIVELCNLILPAIILAMVVFIYSLRHGQMSSHGQNAALEVERKQN